MGVIDSEFIVHQGIQTLGGGSPSAKKVIGFAFFFWYFGLQLFHYYMYYLDVMYKFLSPCMPLLRMISLSIMLITKLQLNSLLMQKKERRGFNLHKQKQPRQCILDWVIWKL